VLVCWPAAEVLQSAEVVEGSAEEPVAALKTAAAGIQLEHLASSAAQAAEAEGKTAEVEVGEDAPEVGTAAEVEAVLVTVAA